MSSQHFKKTTSLFICYIFCLFFEINTVMLLLQVFSPLKTRLMVTHPQFQDALSQIIFVQTQHCSHNSSYMHRGSLHPQFKMQATDTTQAGT